MQFRSSATVVAACVGALVASPAVHADESTTVSGKVYADFSYIDASSDDVDLANTGTGIDVKRFYLGVNHVFDDMWSANVTTDFNYVANDGETQVYIKKAFLQARLSDALTARLGSADLPWVPAAENEYGFRWVENTLIDRLKFGTSADWGIHGLGKLGDGKFSYGVSVINGAGYKNPTRSSSMDVEGRVSFMPVKGLTIMLGGYTGKLGKDVEGSATPALHTASRYDVLVSYVGGPVRVGAEYFQADNWNNVTTAASDKADGYSVWGSYNFTPMFGFFARYDGAKSSKDLNADLKDVYYNAGLVVHPRKNVDLALVYKHDKVDGGGFVNTSNGNIGGADEGKYDEIGIWGQMAF
jgi:hypothetical protein